MRVRANHDMDIFRGLLSAWWPFCTLFCNTARTRCNCKVCGQADARAAQGHVQEGHCTGCNEEEWRDAEICTLQSSQKECAVTPDALLQQAERAPAWICNAPTANWAIDPVNNKQHARMGAGEHSILSSPVAHHARRSLSPATAHWLCQDCRPGHMYRRFAWPLHTQASALTNHISESLKADLQECLAKQIFPAGGTVGRSARIAQASPVARPYVGSPRLSSTCGCPCGAPCTAMGTPMVQPAASGLPQ